MLRSRCFLVAAFLSPHSLTTRSQLHFIAPAFKLYSISYLKYSTMSKFTVKWGILATGGYVDEDIFPYSRATN